MPRLTRSPSVRNRSGINAFGNIRVDLASNFDEALDRLENNVSALSRHAGVLGDPAAATKVLVDITFVLDSIASTLHSDIVERRHIDRRWINARVQFFRRKISQFTNRDWPYS